MTDELPIEEYIGKILRERKMTISVAESCTGGLISSRITNVPGSSDYFERAIVSYSNKSKIELLGVPEEIILKYGAVSSYTAIAMAEGIRKMSMTDIGLAVTGIAGPGGGTVIKPVGTVFIAISIENENIFEEHHFNGTRVEIKEKSSQTALEMLKKKLLQV